MGQTHSGVHGTLHGNSQKRQVQKRMREYEDYYGKIQNCTLIDDDFHSPLRDLHDIMNQHDHRMYTTRFIIHCMHN